MQRRWLVIILVVLLALGVLVGASLLLTPTQTSPAAAAALPFVQALSRGDDAAAEPYAGEALLAYARDNCPDGSLSGCVAALIPPEWGDYVSTVFRRATPEGDHWNIDLISTYEHDLGGSGVCIFARAEQTADGAWQVTELAGFVNCAEPGTRNMASNPEAPNRMPPA